MNFAVIAISCCLLAQQPTDEDPFKPKLVPSKPAPVAIESDAPQPDAQPAVPAEGQPAAAPESSPEVPLATPESTEPAEAAPESNLAPVGTVPRQKLRPPELLAEALATPRQGALKGKSLALLEGLSRTPDRQQQLAIAQAYWRLSAAQAAYHWALNERELVERYTQAHASAPAVESARAAASANVSDAQLAVSQAQQELGDLVGSGAELPLAVDRPHVGNYSTLYDEIFANRPAPPRIRLIHRMLPIRRQAIDAHAAAIVATLDAIEATGEEFQTGGQGLATLMSLVDQLQSQRQSFVTAARDYNYHIAEYLLAVARPGTSDQVLVSRLILTTNQSTPGAATPQPRLSTPPQKESAGPPAQPPVGEGTGAESRISNFQPGEANGLVDDGAVYRGLVGLQPPARVQKLSESLHWDRALPPDAGEPTPLADCLRDVPSGDRLALLNLYWLARERAARYQVLGDQLEQLGALTTAVMAASSEPAMAAAGVRLQAARRATKATLVEAQLALVQSEFDLTQAAGRPLDRAWLRPSTPPQSGRYVVAGDDTLPAAARAWAEMVVVRHGELELRADAVVRCDELRATLGSGVREATGSAPPADAAALELTPFDRIAWAVARQANQSLAFLHNLTEYNAAIARYALATSPSSVSNDELVKKLVIARTARGET